MENQFKVQPCAYLGITVPNFPNFFYVLGPNTVLAHSSLVYMIECQVRSRDTHSVYLDIAGELYSSDTGEDGRVESEHN